MARSDHRVDFDADDRDVGVGEIVATREFERDGAEEGLSVLGRTGDRDGAERLEVDEEV